jgi:cytochrome c peroxidase
MLAGRLADEAPFGWLGDSATLEGHIEQARRRLRARPLQGEEVHALSSYISRARTFLGPHPRSPLEERGRLIFDSTRVGCAECHHTGGDRGDHVRHDVGTGGAFDTPTLRFAGGTAPYMHDGRYATLRELLVRTDGKMGRTSQLREPDILALTAYIRSL